MTEAITIESTTTRFLNADNQLIAFEFMVIIVLCFVIKVLHSDKKEMVKEIPPALNKLSELIAVLKESVSNAKNK